MALGGCPLNPSQMQLQTRWHGLHLTVHLASATLQHCKVATFHCQQCMVPGAGGQHHTLPSVGDKGLQCMRMAGGTGSCHHQHKALRAQRNKSLAAQRVALHLANVQRKSPRLCAKQCQHGGAALGGQLHIGNQVIAHGIAAVDGAVRHGGSRGGVKCNHLPKGRKGGSRQWLGFQTWHIHAVQCMQAQCQRAICRAAPAYTCRIPTL